MNCLIVKLGATGDVLRTTPVLQKFQGQSVTWLTADKNAILLQGIQDKVQCIPWAGRNSIRGEKFDLVINLEDDLETALFVRDMQPARLFGAFVTPEGELRYT